MLLRLSRHGTDDTLELSLPTTSRFVVDLCILSSPPDSFGNYLAFLLAVGQDIVEFGEEYLGQKG